MYVGELLLRMLVIQASWCWGHSFCSLTQKPSTSGDGQTTKGTVERTCVTCPVGQHWTKYHEGGGSLSGQMWDVGATRHQPGKYSPRARVRTLVVQNDWDPIRGTSVNPAPQKKRTRSLMSSQCQGQISQSSKDTDRWAVASEVGCGGWACSWPAHAEATGDHAAAELLEVKDDFRQKIQEHVIKCLLWLWDIGAKGMVHK